MKEWIKIEELNHIEKQNRPHNVGEDMMLAEFALCIHDESNTEAHSRLRVHQCKVQEGNGHGEGINVTR